MANFYNDKDNKLVTGTSGDDSIQNYGEYATLEGGNGSDSLDNFVGYVLMNCGAGNDTVWSAYAPRSTINGGNGNDELNNYRNSSLTAVNGGAGDDSIRNYGANVTISGDTGNDSIENGYKYSDLYFAAGGQNVIINSGDGNDTVANYKADYVSINSGSGADYIYDNSDYATIYASKGNDTITGHYSSCSVNGGAGNDSISLYNWNKTTIKGGTGNDTIYGFNSGGSTYEDEDGILVERKGILYQYSTGDGNDIIYTFSLKDTLSIAGSSYSTTKSGSNIIVTVGEGKISLMGAASLSTVNIEGTEGDSKLITLTEGNDTYSNTVEGATIQALGGKDSINNKSKGKNSSISSDDGDDYIQNSAKNVSIRGGAGNDYIGNHIATKTTANVMIIGDAGNDSIFNWGSNVTINGNIGNDYIYSEDSDLLSISGGAGDDTIENGYGFGSGGSYLTVEGGAGNDSIFNSDGANILFKYSSGDGNDIISGFNKTSTLSIGGGAYSTTKSGKNIIVTVGDGKISLIGAASLSTVHIDGEETPIETNSWKLDGSTATYGTSSNTLIKLTNIKSLEGVSLSGNVVTIAKSAVNAKKITLTGTGYTLALADDVTKRTTKTAAWSYSSGTAIYKSSYKTAGYTLASNAKSITYSKAETPSTLATVKGVKSKSGLTVSGKVITVAESSVNKKKITLTSDDYKLKLADGLTPTTKKAAWSLNSSTATYKSSYKTAGYTLASNSKSITYSKATTPTNLATIKGAKSKTGLSVSGKKITLKNSALKSKVTVSGGYEFNFAADYKNATITGSAKADTITARGANISINAGAGDDTIKLFSKSTVTGGAGADTFIYNKGNVIIADYAAEDTISIASGTAVTSTSDNDLILTVGTSKITITGGKNDTVTYFDDDGKHIYQKASETLLGVKFATSGKSVTLTDDYEADKFDVADFSNYKSKLITINAAKVSQALEIIGNKKSNVITGTVTDDYIDGGAGADSIKGGGGNDTLVGGANNDSLWGGIGSDSIYGGLGDDYLVGGEGRDIFVYNNGDGHDYIDDYQQGVDKIMILSGEKPYIDRTNLSNDVTYIIGEGSLVVKNGINTTVEFIDSNNRLIDKSTPSTAS